MPPSQDFWVLTLACEYGSLHDKWDFADIKWKILRWEDYPELSRWAQWNHKSLYYMESGRLEKTKNEVKREAEFGVMHFADSRKGHEARNSRFQER